MTIPSIEASLPGAAELADRASRIAHGGKAVYGARLGILMLVVGIIYHILFMTGLRKERQMMKEAGLVHAESLFPPSLTLFTAIVLLLIGITAGVSMAFHVGPFG